MHYNPTLPRLFQLAGYASLFFLLYWTVAEDWTWIIYSLLYYKIVVGLFGNQIAQHRYFSHKSFKATPLVHKLLAIVSCTTAISPIVYASVHRQHHKYSDTIKDAHSPNNGFIHSAFTWSWNMDKKVKPAIDLMRDEFLLILHENMYHIIIFGNIMLCLVDWRLSAFIFLAGIGWNYLHMGLFRSALFHMKLPGSYKNFDVADDSWNNKYLQILDIGEGLHNNHHKYPSKYNQATAPGEYDFAGWVVKKLFI